jgi:carboxyl-terminal processing protease
MAIVCSAFAVLACGGPTAPSPAQEVRNPAAAREYLEALLATMQGNAIDTATVDWIRVRAEVLATAAVAQTIPDTYAAVAVALRLLGDGDSYYITRNGMLIGPPPDGGCAGAGAAVSALPADIGYVRVGSCGCEEGSPAARTYAEALQSEIRRADRPGLRGWIVDLRGNRGGNMWPMIAGVGPVLGEGVIGHIIYHNRRYEREYRNGAAMSLGEAFASVAAPYALLDPYPPVALLTDGEVVSAGEAIAVYFRGRPRTRSFGTPTCGHHHLQQRFALSDGAALFLTTAEHADRTDRRYRGPIVPDEITSDPTDTIRRAVGWLHSGAT